MFLKNSKINTLKREDEGDFGWLLLWKLFHPGYEEVFCSVFLWKHPLLGYEDDLCSSFFWKYPSSGL